ncbi:LOB domain-containing protein 13-like [Zea mays]|uniref:LOB domain-containing protein 13-like n=1 Tax=Zea mays TaxID=4577 RepID=UPI001652168E|nr:LOB domain-containing protein 13-like [Zea mays]XP_035821326.1 LOB domain-containing protein 13-like [Zea mays]
MPTYGMPPPEFALPMPILAPPPPPPPPSQFPMGFQTPPASVAAPGDGSGQDDTTNSWVNTIFNTQSPAGGGGYSNHPDDGYD